MIDRNEDAILLSGLSNEVLARKVLDFADRTIENNGIAERDGSVGEVLHRIVPYIADKFGVPVDPERIADRGARDQHIDEEFRVKDMAKEIMAATAYSSVFPGNAMFAKVEEGNPVATLLERYMEKIDMPMAFGPKGETPEPSWAVARIQSGYVGEDAKGTTVIADHMLKKTAEMGHHPVPYWAPGHTEEPRIHAPGSLSEMMANRLTPESRLMHLNEKAYGKRLHALPDKDLAAEMLEQARNVRERHDLKLEEQSGYHRYMTWHGVPMMSELLGGEKMSQDERSHYDHMTKIRQDHAADRREEYVPSTDQQIFDGMSSSVMNGFAEGSRYIVENKEGIKPTLAERVMFNEPRNGNSMVMLLDRVAEQFEVVRGQEYDLVGRNIAEGTKRSQADYAWKPAEPKAAEPSHEVKKSAGLQAAMAMQAQAMGR